MRSPYADLDRFVERLADADACGDSLFRRPATQPQLRIRLDEVSGRVEQIGEKGETDGCS